MNAYEQKGRNGRATGPDPGDPIDIRSVLRGLFGSLAMLVLLKGLELFFFGPGYFASLTLHPFWIVVILAAVLEGPFVGVLTVALATWLLDRPPRPIGVDIIAHFIDTAILPLQWLMAALCLGFYRALELRRLTESERSNRELREVNETLAAEIERLDRAVHAMEVAAVMRGDGGARPDAAALHRAPPADVAERFAAAAQAGVGRPCALYIVKTGELEFEAGAPLEGLAPVLYGRSPALRAMSAAPGAVLLPPGESARALVGAAIYGAGDALSGAIFAACATPDEAEEIAPALELLAGVLSLPLFRIATAAESGSDPTPEDVVHD